MRLNSKRYQYWWYGDYGYHLEEFDNTSELLKLISQYPSSDFYITEKCNYLPGMELKEVPSEKPSVD